MPRFFRKFPAWRHDAEPAGDSGATTFAGDDALVAESIAAVSVRRNLAAPPETWLEYWKAAPVAVAIVAPDGLIDCNPACRALLGQVTGGSAFKQRRWLEASVVRMLATGVKTDVLSAGAERSLAVEIKLGQPIAASGQRLAVLQEVTDRSPERDNLLDLVSTLSHEFRTPLTSLKSSLKLVLDGQTGQLNEDQTHFLDMTMRNVQRLERLVADVLDISRADAGRQNLKRRDVDLGRVLLEDMAGHVLMAEQKGLRCDIEGLPRSFTAHVDPDKVVQILDNVVGNAVKYTPPGGLVRVWLEQRPVRRPSLALALADRWFLPLHTFTLVVEDNGPGIAEEDLQQVFKPFFRAQDEGMDDVPGAGLGLHITRGLVEAHGGSIHLASCPGKGTTAWIRLPRDTQSEALQKAASRLEAELAVRSEAFRQARIMVLDLRRGPARGSPAAVVRRFCREWSTGDALSDRLPPVSPVVTLAPGLVALVANAPERLVSGWQDHQTAHPGADWPREAEWEIFGGTGAVGEMTVKPHADLTNI